MKRCRRSRAGRRRAARAVYKLLNAIVGIELVITRMEGKWKTSQNRSAQDQSRVASELSRDSMPGPARQMGELIAASLTAAS